MCAGRLPALPPPVAHPFLPSFSPPPCPRPLFLPAAFHLTADAFSVTDQVALLDAISALLDASATSAAGVALLLHFGPPVQRHFHLEAVLEDLVRYFLTLLCYHGCIVRVASAAKSSMGSRNHAVCSVADSPVFTLLAFL